MTGWADEEDSARQLALDMAEELRTVSPKHRLLAVLRSLKPNSEIIGLFMREEDKWHTWPVSQVLTVAYSRYYLLLKEAVEKAKTKLAKDPQS